MARIEYVGHATVFVDLDGVRLLTDPLLRNRVAHLRRSTPVAARTRRGVDAVLISHAHYDHLDLPSLEKLGKSIPVVVPRGLGGLLRKRRFESVIEVEVGETLSIGELQIRAVQAEHDGSRSPIGVSADPVGYVVSGSKSVYFAGDTDLFDGMGELGPVDVGAHSRSGAGGRDSAAAATSIRRVPLRLSARIRPGLVVPIHWGTYFPIHLGLRASRASSTFRRIEFLAAMKETAPAVERGDPSARREPGALGGKQVGGRKRRDGLLANLARDVRDVGAERRVGDDVEPRRLLRDLADLDVDRELLALWHLEAASMRDSARVAERRPEPHGRSTVTSRRGSSTERFTRIVETIVVFGTKIRRPSSVVSAV